MAGTKRHSAAEVAHKLAEAADLSSQGELQRDIARRLGITVMTLHRWRKAARAREHELATAAAGFPPGEAPRAKSISELQLENSRLRHLAVELLLEKMRLKEEEPDPYEQTEKPGPLRP